MKAQYDEYREQVWRYSRLLSEGGYFGARSGSSGNVSMLIEGEEAVAITPSGKPYHVMSPEDICIIGFDLRKVEGALEPSVETPMHIAVYRNRPDVNAVMHSHQVYASVLAVIGAEMPAMFDEVALAIGPKVELVPYALSGSKDLLDNVVEKLGNRCHCYILENHGALCIGKNLEKALNYVELLEKNAQVYCAALATGKEVHALPEATATALFGLTIASQDMEIARKKKSV